MRRQIRYIFAALVFEYRMRGWHTMSIVNGIARMARRV